MTAAIRLVREYFWPHARASLRQIGLTERHVNARRVLRWIRARGKAEISLKDVRRDALGERLDAERAAGLLEALARSGWVREPKAVSTPKGGRPLRRWEVNPNLFYGAETAQTAETFQAGVVSAVPAVSAGQIESWQGADDVASGPPNGEADPWPPLP